MYRNILCFSCILYLLSLTSSSLFTLVWSVTVQAYIFETLYPHRKLRICLGPLRLAKRPSEFHSRIYQVSPIYQVCCYLNHYNPHCGFYFNCFVEIIGLFFFFTLYYFTFQSGVLFFLCFLMPACRYLIIFNQVNDDLYCVYSALISSRLSAI